MGENFWAELLSTFTDDCNMDKYFLHNSIEQLHGRLHLDTFLDDGDMDQYFWARFRMTAMWTSTLTAEHPFIFVFLCI